MYRPGDIAVKEVERGGGERRVRRRNVGDIRGVVGCVEVYYSWMGDGEGVDSQTELGGQEGEGEEYCWCCHDDHC